MGRKNLIGMVVVLALATMPGYGQFTLDLSGMSSNGLDGDPGNETRVFNIEDTFFNVILEIEYDIMIETQQTSWFSDLSVRFGNSDGTFHGNWPDTFVPGDGLFGGGTERFTGSFRTDIHLNPDLEFHVSLFELVDDGPGTDAVLLEGSWMRLDVFIPSPGGLAVLAGGGLVFARRRRC